MRPRSHYLHTKVSSYSGSHSLLTISSEREIDIILHNRHVQDEKRRNGALEPLDTTAHITLGIIVRGSPPPEILKLSPEIYVYETVVFIGQLYDHMEDLVSQIIAPFPNMRNMDTDCGVLTLGVAKLQELDSYHWTVQNKEDAKIIQSCEKSMYLYPPRHPKDWLKFVTLFWTVLHCRRCSTLPQDTQSHTHAEFIFERFGILSITWILRNPIRWPCLRC
jgi:hypothetical protein